jgi:hypothetical protein
LQRRSKTVGDYLKELRENRKGKPEQIREALGIYVELWENVIEKRIVAAHDDLDEALSKVEARGGLFQAASSQPPE